jgi:hypothetical protein
MQTDMKEFAVITPRELLETSIAQLWTLTCFLGEQLGEGRDEAATPETRVCHEILWYLSVLIPRLQAAGHGSGVDIEPPLAIVDCDDDQLLPQSTHRRLIVRRLARTGRRAI